MNLVIAAVFGCCFGVFSALFLTHFNSNISLSWTCIIWRQLDNCGPRPTPTTNFDMFNVEILASSVCCNMRLDGSKICKFKNLYYIPEFKEHLLFFLNEFSVVSGVQSIQELQHISLSTIQNHSGVYLKLVMIKSHDYILHHNFSFLESDVFIMKRFKPDNIMHIIHDDLFPLFVTYKELCTGDVHLCLSYQLLFLDDSDEGSYFEWYNLFSVHKPIFLEKQNRPLCIKRGVIGLSNSSIWFQYGFKNTQGPVFNSHFDVFLLKEFTEFIKKQFGIWLMKEQMSLKNSSSIAFFSRQLNRKILNEDIVEDKIKNIFHSVRKTYVNVIKLDLSTNTSKNILNWLTKSEFLVGMHGSAMILAIFMRPGSHIIEMFPFGIQPEFVSPLRALCKLDNVFYHYESWVNRNEINTRTNPDYPPLLGGIAHLEVTEREIIMNTKKVPPVECCHNPLYLFRMFQDTVVDESFFSLFTSIIYNRPNITFIKVEYIKNRQDFLTNIWYFPPPVFNLNCKCFGGDLKVTWDYPFILNGIKFSVATSNGMLAVTELCFFSIKISECNEKVQFSTRTSVSVWVKAVDEEKESLDSFKMCFVMS